MNAIEDEEDVPLEASPAQAVTELEAEEELPEWLTDLDAEVEEAEPAVVDEAATGEVGEEDLPAWLIELEAEPGQGMPDAAEGEVGEQGPSTAQQVSEEEMPDWLSQLGIEEETGEAMPTSQGATESSAQDSAPDWLAELEAEESEQPGFEAVAEDELPDWLTELDMDHEDTEATVIAPVSSEEESLDWLSEIGDESPADISVEAKEEGGVADAVPASEDEGLPQWLGEFGEEGGQDVPEWLVELQEGQVDEQLATEDDRVSESAEQQDVEPISDDELPDWLRELSAEPEADDTESAEALAGVTAPELPSDSLAEAEPELVQMEGAQPAAKGEEEATAPEERMHEATAQEGAPGEPIEPRSEPIEPDIAATSDRAPPAVETAAAVASISQLPPPEEGMPEWLLTLEDEIRQQLGVPAGERQPAPSESSAAEQGWVEDTEPAAETEEVLGTTDEAAVSEPESVAEVEEAEKSPTIESIEAADGRPMGEFLPDQEQVPEWLAALEATVGNDSVTSTTQKELGEHPVEPETVPEWLQELEEEAQVEDLVAEMSDAGAAADTPEAQEHTPITETETPVELGSPETEATVEAYDSALATAPHEHETRLALAAAYLEEDNLDRAAQEYEQLVKVPSLVERVTVTLERKTEEHPDHHALQRVLGDAYMRSGQLQKALAAYKRALATL